MKIIAGIDPGSQITGYAFISLQGESMTVLDWGIVKATDHYLKRLHQIGDEIQVLLKTHNPQLVAVEKVFLGQNPESAFRLGQMRGIILYAAAKINAEISEYATRSVKKSITGNGSSSKEDVLITLSRLLRLPNQPTSLDASDALALAVHCANEWIVNERMKKYTKDFT